MAISGFDALRYYEALKAAGVPEKQAMVQAKVQANAFRDFSAIQEEKARNELAIKGDLRETELRLQKEIEQAKTSLLKWQTGIAIVILTLMAKGFHWIGF